MNQAQAFFHLKSAESLYQRIWETPKVTPKPRRWQIRFPSRPLSRSLKPKFGQGISMSKTS